MFRLQLLIPLVVPAGFASLPGMRGPGTHSRGAEDPSRGPALPGDSHSDLPELQDPPSGCGVGRARVSL